MARQRYSLLTTMERVLDMLRQWFSSLVGKRLSALMLVGLFVLSVGIAPVRSEINRDRNSQITKGQVQQIQRQYKEGYHRKTCESLMVLLNTKVEACDPEKELDKNYFRLISDAIRKQPEVLMQVTLAQQIGDLMRMLGRLNESREFLRESLTFTSNLPPDVKGVVLLSLGNTEQAYAKRIANLESSTDPISVSLACSNKIANGKSEEFYEEASTCYNKAAQEAAKSNHSKSYRVWLFAKLNLLSLKAKRNQDIDLKTGELPLIIAQINKLNTPGSNHDFIYENINLASTLIELPEKNSDYAMPSSELTVILESARKNLSYVCPQAAENMANEEIFNPSDSSPKFIASQLLNNALRRAVCSGVKSDQAYAFGRLGYLYRILAKRNTNSIFQTYAQDSTEKALSLAQPANFPHSAYQWQAQLGDIFTDQEEYVKALLSYEAAINTLKSVRNDLISADSNIQFSFQEDVEPVYRKLVNLLLKNPSQENLDKARSFLQLLQKAELENFLKCSLQAVSQKKIDDLVDYGDNEDKSSPSKSKSQIHAALIYPILLEDRIEIILKLPNSTKLLHYQWKPKSEISQGFSRYVQTKVQEFSERLADSSPDIKSLRSSAREIYDWLIAPLESELKQIDTLIFLPDISFRSIPLGSLIDKEGNYLIKKYAVATTLGLNLVPSKSTDNAKLKMLFLGLTNAQSRNFPNVTKLFEKLKLMIKIEDLQDKRFTSKKLEDKLKTSRVSIVHIATHGQFSSQPNQTYIEASADEKISDSELSRLLRIQNQSNPQEISLLTLAACETATGDRKAALGLAGVSIRSGARSTLATLWKVDANDNTTNLLSDFYEELKQGTPKVKALQIAQVKLIDKLMKSEDPDDKVPYHWAAFTLLGDWR